MKPWKERQRRMAIEGDNVDENLLYLSDSATTAAERRGHGHFFTEKTFRKPTYCHSCCEMLWLATGQCCEVCNYVCHDKCTDKVFSYCSGVAMQLIKNPVAHSWSEVRRLEKKFCCVCRKRCDEKECYECEVCDYFVHGDCRDLAVSDCKESATGTAVLDDTLGRSVAHHHWREGNLPPGTKCNVCRKTCASSECLSGMRCQWCLLAAHAACYKSVVPSECDFGALRPILLPPASLTIPRTELPMEQLLRIRRKEKDAATPSKASGPNTEADPQSGGAFASPTSTQDEAKERDDCKSHPLSPHAPLSLSPMSPVLLTSRSTPLRRIKGKKGVGMQGRALFNQVQPLMKAIIPSNQMHEGT